jgi:hypothetical protein
MLNSLEIIEKVSILAESHNRLPETNQSLNNMDASEVNILDYNYKEFGQQAAANFQTKQSAPEVATIL